MQTRSRSLSAPSIPNTLSDYSPSTVPTIQVNNKEIEKKSKNESENVFAMDSEENDNTPYLKTPSESAPPSPHSLSSSRSREKSFSVAYSKLHLPNEESPFSGRPQENVHSSTNTTTSIINQEQKSVQEEFNVKFSFLNLNNSVIQHSKTLESLLLSIVNDLPQISENLAFIINSIFAGDSIAFINAKNIASLEEAAKKLDNTKLAEYCTKYREQQANNNSQIKYLKV